jgi:NAD(P)-dependent dehydrogenase (short-subunit alcohol dehydrogenase family)
MRRIAVGAGLMTECRFDGRVAVITGGGRGLGRAYAELLGSKGAKVVVNDPGGTVSGDGANADLAQEVVRVIVDSGGEAIACAESVATPAGGRAIIQAALDHFGRIDILIHSAGNVRRGSLRDITQEDFEAVVDVHLMGAFHVVRPAFPVMHKAGYGRVVLTSSVAGTYGIPNVVNYGVSKAGMIGLNNIIALEGAEREIKSNIILPGAVTRMADGLDISRYPPMSPEMVAPVVGWLAHESCSITGEMLISMAGRVARAFISETEGIYRPSWTIDEVRDQIDAIRDSSKQWILSPVPSGYVDHMDRSFDMARKRS